MVPIREEREFLVWLIPGDLAGLRVVAVGEEQLPAPASDDPQLQGNSVPRSWESLTVTGRSLPGAGLDPSAPGMLRGPSAFPSVKCVHGVAPRREPGPDISGFVNALLSTEVMELESLNFQPGFSAPNH